MRCELCGSLKLSRTFTGYLLGANLKSLKRLTLQLCLHTIAVVISLASTTLQAQTIQDKELEQLQRDIESIRESNQVPGLAIALVDKKGVIWAGGLGLADREKGQPATAETLFRMGSVSKMFAGFAVMQLVEQDKLTLDDKVADWLPDLVFQNPWQATHPVRVAHLLEHTTGWDVHTGEYATQVDDTISLKDGLALHTDARVSRWPPGTRQSYSNTGPVVAARIVEEITGMPFEEYAQTAIFSPLAMTNSSFLKSAAFDQLGATGYDMTGPVDYHHIYTRPSSTLSASAQGMANVLTMLVNRGQFQGKTFIDDASLQRMETPQTTLGDQAGIHSGYGLTIDAFGFENFNTVFYGHTGGVPGFAAEVIYQTESGVGYAFMMNQDNPQAFHQLSNRLRAYLLKDAQPKSITKAPLSQTFADVDGYYTPINPLFDLGKFASDITGVIRITADDNFLHRSPFFGGWQSNDYRLADSGGDILYSDWTGLPSIAWVEDPIAGRALQVEGVIYQKTPTVLIYGRLMALATCLFIIASSLVYGLYRILYALWRNLKTTASKPKQSKTMSIYGALLSLLLTAIPAYLVVFHVDIKLIFLSFAFVVAVYAAGALYFIGTVLGWYLSFTNTHRTNFYSHALLAAHTFIVVYLLAYGLLPLNLWA